MLRIRFHGRGGQGMKTASRILGSAAFQAGYTVQDAPIYGAERRGAPMAAFTRIASVPILERGAIIVPDLVVIADETLLNDPAAQPLAGCDSHCTVLLNTTQELPTLRASVTHGGRLLTADCTSMALEQTGTLASLSTALGVAAAHLVDLGLPETLAGLDTELADTHLNPAQREANRRLAEAVYALGLDWTPLQARVQEAALPTAALVDVAFAPPSQAAPSIYSLANSPARQTGNWRQFRPVLQPERCSRCWICFVRCPEAAISLDAQDYPVVDYDVCKGCLLCAHECPTQAFRVEKEVR
jgi:pyruvate ferredoxin oxidoreductase gamma subunit